MFLQMRRLSRLYSSAALFSPAGTSPRVNCSCMNRALKMLRPQLKRVAESLFPETMYTRRFQSWVKVSRNYPCYPPSAAKTP